MGSDNDLRFFCFAYIIAYNVNGTVYDNEKLVVCRIKQLAETGEVLQSLFKRTMKETHSTYHLPVPGSLDW